MRSREASRHHRHRTHSRRNGPRLHLVGPVAAEPKVRFDWRLVHAARSEGLSSAREIAKPVCGAQVRDGELQPGVALHITVRTCENKINELQLQLT
jgi:hypothetical protein